MKRARSYCAGLTEDLAVELLGSMLLMLGLTELGLEPMLQLTLVAGERV